MTFPPLTIFTAAMRIDSAGEYDLVTGFEEFYENLLIFKLFTNATLNSFIVLKQRFSFLR